MATITEGTTDAPQPPLGGPLCPTRVYQENLYHRYRHKTKDRVWSLNRPYELKFLVCSGVVFGLQQGQTSPLQRPLQITLVRPIHLSLAIPENDNPVIGLSLIL